MFVSLRALSEKSNGARLLAGALVLVLAAVIYTEWATARQIADELTEHVDKDGAILQSSGWSCSPAAAANLLRLFGLTKTERDMAALFAHAADVIRTMTFKPDRALDEVNSDYSTTTELADTLQREADVPFRIGHQFASELVNYGRAHHLRASQIPFTEAQRIYADVAAASKVGAKLPLSEEQFRRSLTAENMVTASQGLGGPQPSEVARMLARWGRLCPVAVAYFRLWRRTHGTGSRASYFSPVRLEEIQTAARR